MMEKQMMKIRTFCDAYDMPKTTVLELVYRKDFPAYKIGKNWYIDIPAFLKWREKEHKHSYKYA